MGRSVQRPELSEQDRRTLEGMRDTAAKPYLRERAAAVLKVADGERPMLVARSGLLRRRSHAIVYTWLHRFREEGITGLTIRQGRGRKPAFSPCATGCSGSQDRGPGGGASAPRGLGPVRYPLDPRHPGIGL